MNLKLFIIILLCIVSVSCHGSAKGINYYDREHLQSHFEGEIDIARMSDNELQFIYFKAHDTDANNLLDGCELVQSIIDLQFEHSVHNGQESDIMEDHELSFLVDHIMALMDKNEDGFINYFEFVAAPGIIAP